MRSTRSDRSWAIQPIGVPGLGEAGVGKSKHWRVEVSPEADR